MNNSDPMTLDDLPKDWRKSSADRRFHSPGGGKSVAGVLCLSSDDKETLFIKSEPVGVHSELRHEADKTIWLGHQGIQCPEILDFVIENGRNWMLMRSLPGRDLGSTSDESAEVIVEITASALKDLHSLDPVGCPFDSKLDFKIRQAELRMNDSRVCQSNFDEERIGRAPADLLHELRLKRPGTEITVVAHGDACLPNLIADGLSFSGFVDCGRLGIADRAQDIALAARSIKSRLGERWHNKFLSLCEFSEQEELLEYYRLLDEFF